MYIFFERCELLFTYRMIQILLEIAIAMILGQLLSSRKSNSKKQRDPDDGVEDKVDEESLSMNFEEQSLIEEVDVKIGRIFNRDRR